MNNNIKQNCNKNRNVAILLTLLLLLQSISLPLFTNSTEVEAAVTTTKDFGPFKSVTHSLNLDPGYDKLCKRTLTGEITFVWPEPSTYVDVVFIQDFSGSFDGTIENIAASIKNMVGSLNMGTDIDGTTPKDRAMIVGFKGQDGIIQVDAQSPNRDGVVSTSKMSGVYEISNSPLATTKTGLDSWIASHYNATYANGGTPTVDGLVEAQKKYQAATPSTTNYNNATYTVSGQPRTRKTVYILITDGAANTAKWANIPKDLQTKLTGLDMTKPIPTPPSGYPYYYDYNSTTRVHRYYDGRVYYTGTDYYGKYYYYYENGYYNKTYNAANLIPLSDGTFRRVMNATLTDFSGLSLNWSDNNLGISGSSTLGPTGTVYGKNNSGAQLRHRREYYEVMLAAMQTHASNIRTSGGLSGSTGATLVTSFWEDSARLSSYDGGYGGGWQFMKSEIQTAMQNMAGTGASADPSLYVTSTNITDFQTKLQDAFRQVATSVKDNVTLASDAGIEMGANYSLEIQNPVTKAWTPITNTDKTTSDPSKLYFDFDKRPSGTYRITYHVTETDFKAADYSPVTLSMSFEGETKIMETPKIALNNKKDCSMTIPKTISQSKEDYLKGGTLYKELEKRRSEFSFDSSYQFTNHLQTVKANESIAIRDVIDPRLDILKVLLMEVSKDSSGNVDLVSSATKAIYTPDAPGNQIQVDKTTNTVSYVLPPLEGTIGGTKFPYGGYVGKEYVLVVNVRAKDHLSSTEVEDMRTLLGGGQTGFKGVPNTSELVITNPDPNLSRTIFSNTVRAVPPEFQEPTITKEIKQAEGHEDQAWYKSPIYLKKDTTSFDYRIGLKMPFDTSTYDKLEIGDNIEPNLAVDTTKLRVYYMETATDGTVSEDEVEPAKYVAKVDSATNRLTVTFDQNDTFQFLNTLSEKTLYFEFPVSIKEDADLSKSYKEATKEIRFDNLATYDINGDHKNESNTVSAILPLPEVQLNKVFKDGDKSIPLQGAEFTLFNSTGITDGSDGKIEEIKASADDGSLFFGGLLPGNTYVIKETNPPAGYVASAKKLYVSVDKRGRVSMKDENGEDIATNSPYKVENTKPEMPTAAKFVKLSKDEETSYAKHENKVSDALKLPAKDEEVSYKIEVPVGKVAGFTRFELIDEVDKLLVPDPNSLKVYIRGSDPEKVPSQGIGSVLDGQVKYIITGAFEEIEYQTLVLEYKAKVGVGIKEVFATYPDGVIPNNATITVNNDGKVTTNDSHIQITKGQVSIKKTIQDGANAPKAALPDGMTAGFSLYKVNGTEDRFVDGVLTSGDDQLADILIQSLTISGAESVSIDNLDTGSYYFVETTPPIGYVKEADIIGRFVIPGKGGEVSANADPNNLKAEYPTISKQIRKFKDSDPDPYTPNTLQLGIGTEWEYAIDVKMPAKVDNTVAYEVLDNVPEHFQLLDIKFLVADVQADGTYSTFTENSLIEENFYKPVALNPNKIRLLIPKYTDLNAFGNKVIRIQVKCKVKPGTNLLASGVISADGTIPNTAYLTFGDNKSDSTVRVRPTVLRNLEFTKKFGTNPLGGAEFTLYNAAADGSITNTVAQDRNGKELRNFSDSVSGKFRFENVKAGTYWLKETIAPNGTIFPYEALQIIVSDNAAIKDGETGYITVRDAQGNLLSDMSTFTNNRKTKVGGKKTWLGDDDDQHNTRPDTIQVHLYRKAGVNGTEEAVTEKTVSADTVEYENLPWSYLFETDRNGQALDENNPQGIPYIYYVKENVYSGGKVPNYELLTPDDDPATTDIDESLSMDLTNEMKTSKFAILKKDGDTGLPIEGTTFVLWDQNMNLVDKGQSDAKGRIQFTNELKNGAIYFVGEEAAVSESGSYDYIYNSGYVKISVAATGEITLEPNKFALEDVDGDPATDDKAYVFNNYKKPTTAKRVNGSTNYRLNAINEIVNYSITVPIKGVEDIKKIEFMDTIHSLMEVIPGSKRVYMSDSDITDVLDMTQDANSKDITDWFRRTLSTDRRTVYFENLTQNTEGQNTISQLKNKYVRFEFKARITASLDQLKTTLMQEGRYQNDSFSIPNTGTLILNNEAKNKIDSNEVVIRDQLITMRFMKKVEGDTEGSEAKPLPAGSKAYFDLYRVSRTADGQESSERIRTGKVTDQTGRILVTNIDRGEYFLRETQAPEGYDKVKDVYFKVEINEIADYCEYKVYMGQYGVDGKISYSTTPTQKWDSREVLKDSVFIDDIVDPKPELPTINKQVKAKAKTVADGTLLEADTPLVADDPATTTVDESLANKEYQLTTFGSEFEYIIDVVIPKDDSLYSDINIVDSLPAELLMTDMTSVKYNIGSGEGAEFAEEALDPAWQLNESQGYNASTETYEYSLNVQDENTIMALAGKTIRVIIPAKIKAEHVNKSTMNLVDGKLPNTAKLTINKLFNKESEAKIILPELYGPKFVKVDSTGKQALMGATFELRQYVLEDAQGNVLEEGPALPEKTKVSFVTLADGVVQLDSNLISGMYDLVELYEPKGFTDAEGKFHNASYAGGVIYYTFEVGQKNEQGEDIVRLYTRPDRVTDSGSVKDAPVFKEDYLLSDVLDKGIPILNHKLLEIPVTKEWDDNDDAAGLRPKQITFTLQRAIVNGTPDEIDPKTGKFVAGADGLADTLDADFNAFAKDEGAKYYKKTVAVSKDNAMSLSFKSDPYHLFSEKNKYNILKYTEDGKNEYNYFVIEEDVEGYTANYSRVSVAPEMLEGESQDYKEHDYTIKNTLNSTVVKMNKVDDSQSPVAVAGAMFNLVFNKDGADVTRTLTTDDQGHLDLSQYIYPNNVYTLTEIEAPAGYVKDTTVYTIVTDKEAIPTMYTGYVDATNKGTALTSPQFEVVDVAADPAVAGSVDHKEYVITVVDKKTDVPEPTKKIENGESYTLQILTEEFEYSVEVPVSSVEGYKTFVIEDTVNDLLEIVANSATVTANGDDVKSLGAVAVVGKKITFTIDQSTATDVDRKTTFEQIANKTLKFSFKAKVATGVSLADLQAFVAVPNNASGIPNTATVKVNDKSATSNEVYLVTEDPEDPTTTKTVNGADQLDLSGMDQVFAYKVETKVPGKILGYSSLSIKDTYAKVLEVPGEITLRLVTYVDETASPKVEETSDTLVAGTDYNLIHTPSTADEEGLIEVQFVDDYDFRKLINKTIVMDFDAKLKDGLTDNDLSTYKATATSKASIPNKAQYVLNGVSGPEQIVTVTPPGEPTLDKKVNGKEGPVTDPEVLTDLSQAVLYTIEATVPFNISGYNSFEISDSLNEIFDTATINPSILVDGGTDAEGLVTLAQSGSTVKATITGANIAKYAGKTIRLTIEAYIDVTKDISSSLVAGKIPNTAELIVNGTTRLEDVANVEVPLADVTLTKTGDGKALPAGSVAKFDLFKQAGNEPDTEAPSADTLLGNFDTTDGQLTVPGLGVGKYYFVETVAPTGFELEKTPREFEVKVGADTKTLESVAGNNFANFTVDNKTKEIPDPKKTVADKEHIDLNKVDDVFTYKVEVPVNSVLGWTEFAITDSVDSELTIINDSIQVQLMKNDLAVSRFASNDAHISINDNFIEFRLAESELSQLEGTTVTLSFDAKITKIESFMVAHPDAIVGNKAVVNIGNYPVESNEVTVTPPGEVPTPVKSIDGDQSETPLKLGKKEQSFLYEITVDVPTNVTGYESFTLTDKLESVLETDLSKVTVYEGDYVNAYYKQFVKYDNTSNTVSFTIDNKDKAEEAKFDFKTLAGKKIKLAIEAKFKADVTDEQLKTYIVAPSTDVVVPNTAKLKVNDTTEASNTVNVTPPGDEPTVEKTVKTADVAATNENASLKTKEQEFTYRVNVAVPNNVEGYKSIVIEDTLENVLEIVGTPTVELSGETYSGPAAQVDGGNKVTLNITENFANYVGKTISLVINAKIKAAVSLDQIASSYENSAIPNTATLSFNGEAKDSNQVTVTPLGDTPTPIKDVNEQSDVKLADIKEEFTYNVRYTIPTNVTGFNKLVMTDELEPVLQTSADKIKVYVDEVEDTDLTKKIVIDPATTDAGQKVSLTLDGGEANFKALAGKTIHVEIVTTIKDGADLSAYEDLSIPNTANLELNDDDTKIPSEKVTVHLPLGGVKMTKLAEGQALQGVQEAKFQLYKMTGSEPDTAKDTLIPYQEAVGTEAQVNDFVVNVEQTELFKTNLKPGKYYFVETEAPQQLDENGEVIDDADGNPIRFVKSDQLQIFEIRVDQTAPVSITLDNYKPEDAAVVKSVAEQAEDGTALLDSDYSTDLQLSAADKTFNYKVAVPVTNVFGWSKFELTDQVDAQLKVSKAKVEIIDSASGDVETLEPVLDQNNKISFVYNNPEGAKALLGKTVVLSFDATITDIGEFLKAHPETIVKNMAQVDIGNGPKDSNEVTVTVPGGEPTLNKQVRAEGSELAKELTLTKEQMEKAITYVIDAKIPENYAGYTKFEISDKLNGALLYNEDTVKLQVVDGAGGFTDVPEALLAYSEAEHSVSAILANEAIAQYAGKTLRLSFDATINGVIDLNEFLVEGKLPNTAEIKVNDELRVSDEARVTPPTGQVTLLKTVDGAMFDQDETAEFDLYKVETTGDVKINTDHPYLVDSGKNTIIVKNLEPGDYYFKEIKAPAGYILDETPQNFTITSETNSSVFLEMDNTMGEIPTPVKTVDGYNEKALDWMDQKFEYVIKIPGTEIKAVPTGFVLSDTVHSFLKVVGGVSVTIDEQTAVATVTPVVNTDGSTSVVYTAGEEDLKAMFDGASGKDVLMYFYAKVKDDVTVAQIKNEFADAMIPNHASLVYNGTPEVLSNPVKVGPRSGEVSLKKYADGVILPAETPAVFELYKVVGEIDDVANAEADDVKRGEYTTAANGLITVTDLEPGNYYFKEIAAPAGYVLDSTPREFTIAAFTNGDTTTVDAVAGPNFNFTPTVNADGSPGTAIEFAVNNEKIVLPEPTKDVSDEDESNLYHVNLAAADEVFSFKVEVPVTQVGGWTDFALLDPVDKSLTVDESSIKLVIGTTEYTVAAPHDATVMLDAYNVVAFQLDTPEKLQALVGRTVVLSFNAKITDLKAFLDAHPNGIVENEAKVVVGNDSLFSNKVTVAPPEEDPTPTKDVNEKTEIALGTLDQSFTYHVGATVPYNISKFTKYTLVDNLEDVLLTSKAQIVVKVNGTENTELTNLVTVSEENGDKNIVRLDIPLLTLDNYRGKHIEISIEASVDPEADLSSYLENRIPNQASLTVGDTEDAVYTTEEVGVTPPNDAEPTIKKEIAKEDGSAKSDTKLDLAKKEDSYTYYVTVDVPKNTNGFTKLVIEDTLAEVLQVGETQVRISDGSEYKGAPAQTDVQKVSLDLSSVIKDIAGKSVTLEIKASIKADADLSVYEEEKVPNKASLIFNDKQMESNKVLVVPPGITPEPNKNVNDKPSETLGLKTQEFTYNIWADIPSNVTGYTNLNLTDDLEDVLEVVSTKVTVAAVEDTVLTEAVVVDEASSKVTVDITEGFDKLAGKRINLAISAKIKADADLSAYEDYTIPNKASLSLNDGDVKETENVPVTAPNDMSPTIEKFVGTSADAMSKDDLTLAGLTDAYLYRIDVTVPKNVLGYEQIMITDSLEAALEISEVKILVDGNEDAALTGLVEKVENTVSFELNNAGKAEEEKFNFKDYAEKTISMLISANIKDGSDLSMYLDGLLPNTASLTFNGSSANSNTVNVIPPGESPTISKDVNDQQEFTVATKDEVFTYHIKASVPINISKFTSYVLEDNLEDVLLTSKEQILVKVDGTVNSDLSNLVTVSEVEGDKNIVSLNIPLAELSQYRGKSIELSVKANVDPDADLSKYTDNKIPNKASLTVGDNPEDRYATGDVFVKVPKITSVTIQKIWEDDENSGNTRPDSLAFQAIQSLNGAETGKVYTEAFTVTADGIYSIEKLPEEDKQGNRFSYSVKELAVFGYKPFNPDKVTGSGTSEDPFVITNTLIPSGNLEILKTDDFANVIPDVYFQISGVTNTDFTAIAKTDAAGQASFTKLPIGEYQLSEVNVLDGYEISSETWTVTVDDEGQVLVNGNVTAVLRIENKIKPVSFSFMKENEEGVPLDDAVFRLTATSGEQAGSGQYWLASSEAGLLTFDASKAANPNLATALKPGNYELVENTAPAGYMLTDGVSYVVSIDNKGIVTINGNDPSTFKVVNAKINRPGLSIIKVDEANNILPEASFELYYKAKTEEVDSAASLSDEERLSGLVASLEHELAVLETVLPGEEMTPSELAFGQGTMAMTSGELALTNSELMMSMRAEQEAAERSEALQAALESQAAWSAYVENELANLTWTAEEIDRLKAAGTINSFLLEKAMAKDADLVQLQEALIELRIAETEILKNSVSGLDEAAFVEYQAAKLAELNQLRAELSQLEAETDKPVEENPEALMAESAMRAATDEVPEGFKLYTLDPAHSDGIFTTENGVLIITELPDGEYLYKEIVAPEGYEVLGGFWPQAADGTVAPIIIDETSPENIVETVVNKPLPVAVETRDLVISKSWFDSDGKPIDWPEGYSLDFTVYADGVPMNLSEIPEVMISDARLIDGGIVHMEKPAAGSAVFAYGLSITGLPKYANGSEIVYSVKEAVNEPEIENVRYYIPTEWEVLEADRAIHFDNKDPNKESFVEVQVKKEWVGDSEATRPQHVIVQLEREDGTALGTVTLNAENDWFYSFPTIPTDSSSDVKLAYTVKELIVPDGYEVKVSKEEPVTDSNITNILFTVTNTKVTEPEEPTDPTESETDPTESETDPTESVTETSESTTETVETSSEPTETTAPSESETTTSRPTEPVPGEVPTFVPTEPEVTGPAKRSPSQSAKITLPTEVAVSETVSNEQLHKIPPIPKTGEDSALPYVYGSVVVLLALAALELALRRKDK